MIERSSGKENAESIAVYAGEDELIEQLVYKGDRQLAMIDGLLHDLFSDDGFMLSDDMSA